MAPKPRKSKEVLRLERELRLERGHTEQYIKFLHASEAELRRVRDEVLALRCMTKAGVQHAREISIAEYQRSECAEFLRRALGDKAAELALQTPIVVEGLVALVKGKP